MKNIFNKERILFVVAIIITSLITTSITSYCLKPNKTSSNSTSVKSTNSEVLDPASEYTSLNSRLTTLENTISPIGTYKYSFPDAGATASIELEKGTWLIVGGIAFSSNATGYRRMTFNNIPNSGRYGITSKANSGTTTILNGVVIATLTSKKTVSLSNRYYAGSGGNLTVTQRMQAIRLK